MKGKVRYIFLIIIRYTLSFMLFQTAEEVHKELKASGASQAEIDVIGPHKEFLGNRPTNSIVLHKITPRTLGALIGCVSSHLWEVNYHLKVPLFQRFMSTRYLYRDGYGTSIPLTSGGLFIPLKMLFAFNLFVVAAWSSGSNLLRRLSQSLKVPLQLPRTIHQRTD
jgi:hypothetical protein